MAQRTVALCDGKYIGIETIYTVINGRQINIPDKLKELREKSQHNELFCPCGCKTNLILVAGDKNLREQHFREKTGTGVYECTMPEEGKISVDSKIVLKCWLDDKLHADDIESRVPIDMVEETKRKPEFTFLSRRKLFAIRYWRTRANILDDRLDVLDGNYSGISVIYIVDSSNGGCEGQYPEALMKLQGKQGYCLLLTVKEIDYCQAKLRAVYYDKNIDELWEEIEFANAYLREFEIVDNKLFYKSKSLAELLSNAKSVFVDKQAKEKERREAEALRRQLEAENRQKEYERQRQIWEAEQEEKKRKIEEAEKQRRIKEEQRKLEEVRKEKEKKERKENFKKDLENLLNQQKEQVKDLDGNRWIRCEFCGLIAVDSEFLSYGGLNRVNLGTCKNCAKNNPNAKVVIPAKEIPRRTYDPTKCPECVGTLRERNGRLGKFLGCSNYPKCTYTKSIRNK